MSEFKYEEKLRKYLKLSIVNRNKEDYRVLKLAIKNVFNHLCKQDFYYETNSSKIFETIYIRKTNKKIFQISAIYYMDQIISITLVMIKKVDSLNYYIIITGIQVILMIQMIL